MDRTWYAFKNSTDTEVELYLYDEIGFFGVGAKQFISDLRAQKGKHVHLRINSPGGEVVEGTAIYNALSRHEGGITVHIDALAASMASVIAMAGNPVYMADNALLMIHDPWMFAGGNADELRKNAELLDTMKSNLVRAYTKKSGIPEDEISAMMSEETWMDSTTAVALGFVDAIEDGVQAAAHMTPEKAKARFDIFKRTMNAESETPAPETTETPAPEVVETPAPVEAPAPEVIETPETEAPAPEAPQAHADLVAAMAAVVAERDQFRARISVLEAENAAHAVTIERLQALAGVAPAAVVPAIGAQSEPQKSLLEQFAEITDPAERTRFYRKHSAELKRLSAGAGN